MIKLKIKTFDDIPDMYSIKYNTTTKSHYNYANN